MTQNHLTDIVFLNVKLLRVQTMTQHKSIGDRNTDADKDPQNQVISYRVSIFNCFFFNIKTLVASCGDAKDSSRNCRPSAIFWRKINC